jgi:hypothetical protein
MNKTVIVNDEISQFQAIFSNLRKIESITDLKIIKFTFNLTCKQI